MDDNKRENDVMDDALENGEQLADERSAEGPAEGPAESFEDNVHEHNIVLEVSDGKEMDSVEINTMFDEVSNNNEKSISVSASMAEDVIDTSVKKPAGKPAQKVEGKQKEKRPDKNRSEKKIANWFKEIKAEFTKIVWPNKTELSKMTVTVIITSLIIGVLIAGLDIVFNFAVGILIDLL